MKTDHRPERTPAVDYARIRGFNYMPGYAGSLQMIWTAFDRRAWEREVAWSKRFRTNMLRVWLDWHAWIAIGDRMLDALDQALEVFADNEIYMMPVLFNRWNDYALPMGMVADRDLFTVSHNYAKFEPYVAALMDRFGKDDRIGIWDLCNEPEAPRGDYALQEMVWLLHVAEWVRQSTSRPITVGTTQYQWVRVYAPLVDVISFHPYTMKPGEMDTLCRDHKAIASEYGKPLICTEACKGSFDDHERGRQARDDIQAMNRHGVGWLVWQLSAGNFITGSRERADGNSLQPGQGFMPFILQDGTTRPGHEWLEDEMNEL